MATRREKLVESLAKEDRKQDLKRLKKAAAFLGLADETLQREFHCSEFEIYVESIRSQITDFSVQLNQIVAEG